MFFSENDSHLNAVEITAQLHSKKHEVRLCASSNPTCSVLKIHDGKDRWQRSWLEIRLNAFRQSTIPQKQFIISDKLKTYNFIRKTLPNVVLARIKPKFDEHLPLSQIAYHEKGSTGDIIWAYKLIIAKVTKRKRKNIYHRNRFKLSFWYHHKRKTDCYFGNNTWWRWITNGSVSFKRHKITN